MKQELEQEKTQHEEHFRKFQDANLSDDFLFMKTFSDPDICRRMLELLLGIPIKQVVMLETQKTVKHTAEGKGIRMDLYMADDKEQIFNVELQCKPTRKDMPKRARYYGSSTDINLIGKGDNYRKLNTSFVIFICTFDLFYQGRHMYTFHNCCKEDSALALGDGTTKLFFNTKGTVDDVSEEVLEFLHYIEDTTDEFAEHAKTEFIRDLHRRVNYVKRDQRMEEEYMTLQERDLENREEGRIEGILEVCQSLGASKEYITQQIAKSLHLTLEEAAEQVEMILQ